MFVTVPVHVSTLNASRCVCRPTPGCVQGRHMRSGFVHVSTLNASQCGPTYIYAALTNITQLWRKKKKSFRASALTILTSDVPVHLCTDCFLIDRSWEVRPRANVNVSTAPVVVDLREHPGDPRGRREVWSCACRNSGVYQTVYRSCTEDNTDLTNLTKCSTDSSRWRIPK